MEISVRKAGEDHRQEIARCIAEGFEKDFSVLCRDKERVAAAIAPGLEPGKFYIAEAGGTVVGTLAVSDRHGRAARVDRGAMRKHLGLLKGIIGTLVLREEFEVPLDYPPATGYLEFVTVRQAWRGKGIASRLVRESMALSGYRDFVLDVTDINTAAIRCYTRLGFREFKRVPEKHPKQKGFGAKVYMRYEEEMP
ncbi:MAG: GNAT family N-acetyltransferase [Angelakisella sp.]|jgi:ribosomal protein S18 acetylase RimI-like enzyme|nr:GNAT family N-acetyltransferase [Angelakisella sp.]